MPTLLRPVTDKNTDIDAGTISELAQKIFGELSLSGYSLLLEDVQQTLLDCTLFYAGWALLEIQKRSEVNVVLDENMMLDASEWIIILPLFKAECDLKQARLAEAARSMGIEMFGLSVSEANQIYDNERDKLPRAAFVCAPWTIGETE